MPEPIIITLNKTKLILNLISSLIFVALGVWILTARPDVGNIIFNIPIIKYGAGIASVIFFGFGVVVFIRRLTDKEPALVIDDKGIIDNSTAVAAGLIPWEDITHIYTRQVMNQKFIMIGVSNPETYIGRHTSGFKKRIMRTNLKTYGSPISIAANGLKTDFTSLVATLNERWSGFKMAP